MSLTRLAGVMLLLGAINIGLLGGAAFSTAALRPKG